MELLLLIKNYETYISNENWNNNVPDELIGIKNVNIPVIARCGDFHATQRYDIISFHEKYNID